MQASMAPLFILSLTTLSPWEGDLKSSNESFPLVEINITVLQWNVLERRFWSHPVSLMYRARRGMGFLEVVAREQEGTMFA